VTDTKICLASKVVQDRPPEEVIQLAAALGYGGVEWFCLPQHLPSDMSLERVNTLAAQTRDAGLATVCLSTYVGGFAEVPDSVCNQQLRVFERYLAIAERLHCPLVRIWPDDMGRTLREPVSDAQLQRAARYIQLAADRAAERGLRVAVETHQTIGADLDLVLRLLKAVDRPNAGVIFDPGNLYLARRSYGAAAVRHLSGRIAHVQIKDGSLERPTPPHLAAEPALRFGGDFDLLIGEGMVDLRGAITALRDAGYTGWYSVESHALPRPHCDSAAIAATELASLRRLLED
jgi:sugar phosphate isomerase/epimerase